MIHLKTMTRHVLYFLDISKAFDKVWHDGIIFKLKCNGISRNFLNFFENYLQNRFQRVVLNGKESHWKCLKDGVTTRFYVGFITFSRVHQ